MDRTFTYTRGAIHAWQWGHPLQPIEVVDCQDCGCHIPAKEIRCEDCHRELGEGD